MRWLRCRVSIARDRSDSGFTLVEYIVAMSIFSVVIVVMMSAMTMMMRDLRKSQSVSEATDNARKAFSALDKQVRYASAINRPVRVGNDWYVEFEVPDGAGVTRCRQWRLVAATDLLQQRSWTGTVPASTPAWQTVSASVANDPTTLPPFVFSRADTTYPLQQLAITLKVARGAKDTGTDTLTTSMSGRNTSTTTSTNDDVNTDGVSDTQVCQGVARS